MTRSMRRKIFCLAMGLATLTCVFTSQVVRAANSVVWESGNSLIDTTNYMGLAQYWWFANFNNSSAVTGAPMNQNEARNLPSWIHLETNPGCIGKADDCSTGDSTIRTGFSFSENTGTGAGATSTGGQSNFNTLVLPDASSGLSGEAVDTLSTTGNTSSMLSIRLLAGAPSSLRMWVVTDNGSPPAPGSNYQDQARMRVNLRYTGGPPYTSDIDTTADAEAMPAGVRIGQTAVGHNGIADAWAFHFNDVNPDDLIIVKPTSAASNLPAFAGIMIQVVPEPSSMMLLAIGAIGFGWFAKRGRRS